MRTDRVVFGPKRSLAHLAANVGNEPKVPNPVKHAKFRYAPFVDVFTEGIAPIRPFAIGQLAAVEDLQSCL